MRRIIGIAIGALVALGLVVLLAKDIIAKSVLTAGVRALTGLELSVGSIHVGLLKTSIDVRNLTILNPPGFQERTLAVLPRIYVNYDLGAFLRGAVHLEEVKIVLDQFTVVRGGEGRVNLMALRSVREQQTGQAVPPATSPPGKPPQVRIDVLELEIGKVVLRNEAGTGAPTIQEYPIHLRERYTRITDLQGLVQLIIVRALAPTNIARLVGLNLGQLADRAALALDQMTGLPLSSLKSALLSDKEIQVGLEGVRGAVRKTAETLKRLIPSGQ